MRRDFTTPSRYHETDRIFHKLQSRHKSDRAEKKRKKSKPSERQQQRQGENKEKEQKHCIFFLRTIIFLFAQIHSSLKSKC
jgi:hypothetical protein